MPLIKNDKLIEDSWVAANDDEPLPLAEAIIVSLERWQAARGELLSRNGRLGPTPMPGCCASATATRASCAPSARCFATS
jgi:uncharacterized protein (DUF934 family)